MKPIFLFFTYLFFEQILKEDTLSFKNATKTQIDSERGD